MRSKQLGGVVAIAAGIGLFIFSMYASGRIAQAKSEVSSTSSLFSGNPVGNAVGNMMQGKASQYDTSVKICEYGGIVLVILGAMWLYISRKK